MAYKTLECEHCESEFEGWHNCKYCSNECRRLAHSVEKECSHCGENFMHRETQSEGKYCSRDCQYKGRRIRKSKVCEECGSEFEVTDCESDRQFCSKNCSYSNRALKRITVVCGHCGDGFTAPLGSEREYCSNQCSALDQDREARDREPTTCENCGDEYVPNTDEAGRFCSRECFGSWRSKNVKGESHWQYDRIEKSCPECGASFDVLPSRIDRRKYCSMKCLAKGRSGEGAPNWKGGHVNYYGENWRQMRRVVRNRDCFRCRKCGMHEDECDTELHVHHIVPIRKFDEPEDANTPNNLVTVCPSCHKKVEGDVEAGQALL